MDITNEIRMTGEVQ